MAMRQDQRKLLRTLQDMGCVEITPLQDEATEPHVLVYHGLPPHSDVGHPAGFQHAGGVRRVRAAFHAGGRADVPQNAGPLCAAHLRRGENGTNY